MNCDCMMVPSCEIFVTKLHSVMILVVLHIINTCHTRNAAQCYVCDTFISCFMYLNIFADRMCDMLV